MSLTGTLKKALPDAVKRPVRRVIDFVADTQDEMSARRIGSRPDAWPCLQKKYLLVGAEASGTSIIALLLWRDGSMRFLDEGKQQWVWDAYISIYEGRARIRDYPRLQLFDAVKVPGFAAILDQYVKDFPNSGIVYVLRDPRDVLAGTYKRWGAKSRAELGRISWVRENWLRIESQDPVVRLATRWRRYYEASLKVPGVHYVRYEDFCADKVRVTLDLAGKLGLRLDESWVRANCDRQATADFRPYVPQGPGSWKKGYVSEHDAKLIQDVCGAYMEQWRYL